MTHVAVREHGALVAEADLAEAAVGAAVALAAMVLLRLPSGGARRGAPTGHAPEAAHRSPHFCEAGQRILSGGW